MRDDYSGNYILAPMNHIFQPEVTPVKHYVPENSSFPEITLGVPGRKRDALGCMDAVHTYPEVSPKDHNHPSIFNLYLNLPSHFLSICCFLFLLPATCSTADGDYGFKCEMKGT